MTLRDQIYFMGGRCDLCQGRIWFNFSRYWGALAAQMPLATGKAVPEPFFAVHRKCYDKYRIFAAGRAAEREAGEAGASGQQDRRTQDEDDASAAVPVAPAEVLDESTSHAGMDEGMMAESRGGGERRRKSDVSPPQINLDQTVWLSKPLLAKVQAGPPECYGQLIMHVAAQSLAKQAGELLAWFAALADEHCPTGGPSPLTARSANDVMGRIAELAGRAMEFSELCRGQVHLATGRDPAGTVTPEELDEYISRDGE